jgi:hypothetical protein
MYALVTAFADFVLLESPASPAVGLVGVKEIEF